MVEYLLNDVMAHAGPLALTHVPQAAAPGLRLWVSVVERDVLALLKLYGGDDVFARGDAAFQVGTWDSGTVQRCRTVHWARAVVVPDSAVPDAW